MKQRIMAWLLTAALLGGLLPISALAEQTAAGEGGKISVVTGWTWADMENSLPNNTLTVPNVSAENPAAWETVEQRLPTEIDATVQGVPDPVPLALGGWACPEGYDPALPGEYTAVTSLADDTYALDADTAPLQLTVALAAKESGETVNGIMPLTTGSVSYLDYDTDKQTWETKNCTTYTEVTSGTTNWSDGWYVVKEEVSLNGGVTVTGTVHLILSDGCHLKAGKGAITVTNSSSLTIYAQSTGTTMGQLTVQGEGNQVGIDNGGTLTINGGTVTAKGTGGAGIGGGNSRYGDGGAGGTVIINGGTVTATGSSAGIGGGSNTRYGNGGAGGTVIINGGTVTATGAGGAGIGGGNSNALGGAGGTVIINGGTVTAKGTGGAGIGGGKPGGAGATVTITGGTVTATGGEWCAGIGGGTNGAGGTVAISGGTVTATGGYLAAGIGGGNGGSGDRITISGGTVAATGGNGGAGIGGGGWGVSGTVTISGGTVTATAGNTDAAGIGSGDGGNSSGNTFSTGENGGAFIVASSISDNSEEKKNLWRGVIFEGESNGQIYGDTVTLSENATVPTGKNLEIATGKVLNIPDGVTFTNSGTVTNAGTINTYGTWSGSKPSGGGALNTASEVQVNVSLSTAAYDSGTTLTITASVTDRDNSGSTVSSGNVTFYRGAVSAENKLGDSVAVNNGTAICSPELTAANGWTVGTHTITAVYGGSGTLLGSSGTATLTIKKAEQTEIPEVGINYTDETLSTTTAMQYQLSGSQWTDCTGENMAASAFGWDGKTKVTVKFRFSETESYNAGTAEDVTIPARPPAPNLTLDTADEGVTISTDYFYNTTGADYGNTWTQGDSNAVPVGAKKSIYIYKAAVTTQGHEAFKSAVQTITAPSRGATPTLTLDTSDESVTVPAGYYYGTTGADYDKITSEGNGSPVTVKPETSIHIYKAATDTAYKSAVQTINAPGRGATPTLSLDTSAESVEIPTGYLYGTESAEYGKITSKGDGSPVTVEPETKIYIYKAATDDTYKSAVQTINAPGRGTTPTVSIDFMAETLNTSADMEYKVGEHGEWQSCTDSMNVGDTAFGWNGTAAVMVRFRTAATEQKYASDPTDEITIAARPAAPAAPTVTERTKDTIKVAAVTGQEYRIGDGNWQDSGSFTGLTAGTEYTISTRTKAVDSTAFASSTSSTATTTAQKDGSITLKPGEKTEIGDKTITNQGTEITVESGESPKKTTTITRPESGDTQVGPVGGVAVPEKSTVKTDNGPEIGLTKGGSVDGDGSVTGEEIKIGDTVYTGPGASATPEGAVTVPENGSIKHGDTEIKLPQGGGVDKDGNITVSEGGSAQLGSNDPPTTITPSTGTELKPKEDGGVEVLGDATVKTGTDDPEIELTKGGSVDGDGGVTGEEIKIGDTVYTGTGASATPEGSVSIPTGGGMKKEDGPEITFPQGGSVTGDTITVPSDGTLQVGAPPTTITPPEHGGITVTADGKLELPKDTTVQPDGGPAFTVGAGSTYDPAGNTVSHTITFDTGEGGSAVPPQTVTHGGQLTKPADPTRSGYTFGGWYKEQAFQTPWTFETDTVTGSVTLYAKWTQNRSGGGGGSSHGKQPPATVDDEKDGDKPETPSADMSKYTDLDPDAWYYEAVRCVVEHGLFNGTSETTFSPDETMTRAMLMTVLARADGKDTTTPAGGSWYDVGMRWAMEQGISDGTNPGSSITREQLAAMLHRYAGSPAATGTLDGFADADTASGYAGTALRWAVEQGILTGKGGGALDPKGQATRAEVAAMLMRYMQQK